MTSKQLKYGLTNTVSGNLNKKQFETKYKQIDIEDFDVQMISKEFLQSKTLKKPLKQYQIQMDKTNSYGIRPQSDKTQKNKFQYNHNESVFKNKIEDQDVNLKKTQKFDYTFISYNQNIKPAYKPIQNNFIVDSKININEQDAFSFNDNNTIFSAMMKKGLKNKKSITFVENLKQKQTNRKVTINEPVRQVGKAQIKLKQLFNKTNNKSVNEQKNPKKLSIHLITNNNSDIQQDIQQSINQYNDQQFQQYSQGSAIKQSIRQSIGYTSSAGKPIKSQILQQIQQSIRGSHSASKQQIQQFIASYKSSNMGIKQQINQSLSGSKKSKEEQVYEEIFQQYEDQLSHSRSGFKKSSFKDSNDQFSKSFRKKTNVIKSIKLAEEISVQTITGNKEKNNILADNLVTEKKSLQERKANIQKLFKKKQLPYNIPDKNKNLFYEFKIQINKLLTSENFQSKLKKLTSFINTDDNNSSINLLEDKILKNIMQSIQKIKKPQIGVNQIQKLRQQYDHKLTTLLRDQQINLKVQMDRKLHQKELQYKKMIAQLQQKFQGKAFSSAKINNFISQQNYNGGYDLDSDYSIDSDNISWKVDLWEVLPENEKRKLYEKQTKQVTNFLTEIMMNQLKEQTLNRSLDISFEFPDDINQKNNSNISNQSNKINSSLPTVKSNKKFTQDEFAMPKSAFNRKQIQQNISILSSSSSSSKKQSIFPDFPRPKQKQIISIPSHKQNVNQYSKIQGQIPIEPTKKDLFIKQKIIQILSKYKASYLRKKNDVIRKILKALKPKDSKKVPQQNLLSIVQQISILPKQDIHPDQLLYVRCYQQQLIWSLVHIITKNQTKKTQTIQQQMRKQYDRLVVVCQIKTVEQCQEKVTLDLYEDKMYSYMKNNVNVMAAKPCPLEISFKDEAIQMLEMKQERKVKDQLVEEIMKSLMTEFSKEFPKRKK